MTDDRTSQPERFKIDDMYVPIPVGTNPVSGVALTGLEFDNVNHAATPEGLVTAPGEAGVKTEWDASSLDSAIDWLETHAAYLNKLTYKMVDIQDLMGGATAGMAGGVGGQASPLGGFEWAGRLAAKHQGLYRDTEAGVQRLAQNLYDAAEALRQVKQNYETAEEQNRMSALDMQRVFGDVAGRGDGR
ncbi:WXG100 family type VII secretion target [Micromonospora profundi]|uniref:WXG100 family type VII secretion target n=1 Tax=Micromonospora TaxID=1873 RepID=UPI0033BF4C9A